jgi:C4-dicarboxylate-binding protein DctP
MLLQRPLFRIFRFAWSVSFAPVFLIPVLLLAGASVAQAGSVAAESAAAKPVVIRFSHIVSGKAPKGQMAQKFKELAEKRLPGRVVVRVYARAMMYEDDQVVDAIRRGDLELAAPAVSKLQPYTSRLQLFDLPFLFEDMAAVDRFQQGPAGQALLSSMAAVDIKGLGFLHNGMKQLSANSPLVAPLDAAGKRFRIMSSNVLEAQFNALGAVAKKVSFGDVFSQLESGGLDGQENTWSNMYTSHIFRAQSNITETNHGVLDYMVITSNTFWDNLPADMREPLNTAMQEAIAWGNAKAEEENLHDRELIRKSGESKLLTLTAGQRLLWVNAMRPVWDQFAPQIGGDLIKAALAANQSH